MGNMEKLNKRAGKRQNLQAEDKSKAYSRGRRREGLKNGKEKHSGLWKCTMGAVVVEELWGLLLRG